MRAPAIALSAVLLAACGGGGGPAPDAGTAQPPAAPPSGTAFFITLQNLVRGTPDDTEPAGVEGITLDAADDGEPHALE